MIAKTVDQNPEPFDANKLWLHHMKLIHPVSVMGESFEFRDFYTSEAIPLAARDMDGDAYKIRHRSFNQGDIILDLGANVGVFSVVASRLFPQTRIIALEPVPCSFENLSLNVSHARCENISLLQMAVSGNGEPLTLGLSPVNSGSASIHWQSDPHLPKFEVPSITLDALFESQKIGRCAFMKVDIEGSEFEACKAATIWDRCDFVSIELHWDSRLSPQENKEMQDNLRAMLLQRLRPDQLLMRV